MNLYPNPAENIVNLTFDAEESGVTNIMIMDVLGAVQISEQVNLKEGANNIELNVASLRSGNYFLVVGNNDLSSAIQLIKQ